MRAFCTYCSRHKRTDPGLLPASQRYQSTRIDAVYASARLVGAPFFILSGEFGLLAAEQPIPWYDHLLTSAEAPALAVKLATQLREAALAGLVYFTEPLGETPIVQPYHDALMAACAQLSLPVLTMDYRRSSQPRA